MCYRPMEGHNGEIAAFMTESTRMRDEGISSASLYLRRQNRSIAAFQPALVSKPLLVPVSAAKYWYGEKRCVAS